MAGHGRVVEEYKSILDQIHWTASMQELEKATVGCEYSSHLLQITNNIVMNLSFNAFLLYRSVSYTLISFKV